MTFLLLTRGASFTLPSERRVKEGEGRVSALSDDIAGHPAPSNVYRVERREPQH